MPSSARGHKNQRSHQELQIEFSDPVFTRILPKQSCSKRIVTKLPSELQFFPRPRLFLLRRKETLPSLHCWKILPTTSLMTSLYLPSLLYANSVARSPRQTSQSCTDCSSAALSTPGTSGLGRARKRLTPRRSRPRGHLWPIWLREAHAVD